jgi:hypothetical protein
VYAKVLYIGVDIHSMIINHPNATYWYQGPTSQLEDRLRELEAEHARLAWIAGQLADVSEQEHNCAGPDCLVCPLVKCVRDRIKGDNKLVTELSDKLLRQIRDFLDAQADMVVGGCDPAQEAEPNDAMMLLQALDFETGGEFK